MNEVERQVAPTKKSKALVIKGFVADIEKLTEENSDFRRVLYTGIFAVTKKRSRSASSTGYCVRSASYEAQSDT